MGYIVNIDKYPIGVYRICKENFMSKCANPHCKCPNCTCGDNCQCTEDECKCPPECHTPKKETE